MCRNAVTALLLLACSLQFAGAQTAPGGSNAPRYPLDMTEFVSRYPAPEYNPPPSLEQLVRERFYDFDPYAGIGIDGFTLFTVDDLGNHDPAQQDVVFLRGRKLDDGNYHLVIGVDNATAIFDLFTYVRYHSELWHPIQCEPGSAFGLEGDRLFFSKLDIPGVVLAGSTRIRPDETGGIKHTEGVVCEFVFEPRACDHEPYWLERTPDGAHNQVDGATAYLDPEGCGPVLFWREVLEGDLNHDGVVSFTDYVPISRMYGHLSTDGRGDDWDWQADANRDGEVNYKDTFVIEENYGAQLDGYRIYRRPAGSTREHEELLPHSSFGLLPMSIHRPLAWRPNMVNEYRYYDLSLPLPGGVSEWTYRIVPYNATDDLEGEGSDLELSISYHDGNLKVK